MCINLCGEHSAIGYCHYCQVLQQDRLSYSTMNCDMNMVYLAVLLWQ